MTICEICNENEADFEDHYEEHIPNPKEIDVCKSCHSKIHSSWKWILRKEPNACPIAVNFAKNPEKVDEKPTYDEEKELCYYPAQFAKRKSESSNDVKVHSWQKCSEVGDGSYLDCNIFSYWYWDRYFKTLEGLDDG